jgi:hypothetical protein
MRELNQAQAERDEWQDQAKAYLKKIEDKTWIKSVGNALVDRPSIGMAPKAARDVRRGDRPVAPTRNDSNNANESAGAALAVAHKTITKSINEIQTALNRPEWEQGIALIKNAQGQNRSIQEFGKAGMPARSRKALASEKLAPNYEPSAK